MLKPKALVAATSRWFPIARLAMALSRAGFAVDAICPARHPLSRTGVVREVFTYCGLDPNASFAKAIGASNADIIVPGDDLSTQHLHDAYVQNRTGKAGQAVCALIERSLGSPENFAVLEARARTIRVAGEEGVRVPRTKVIANLEDLRQWVVRMGLPAVLKADHSSGGDGVRIVHSLEQAERAYRSLSAPPFWVRAAKRALIDQDTTLIWPSMLRRRHTVSAQVYVSGREATSTVVCWKGSVLAALHFEVLNKADATGPATVLRLVDDAEMSSAAHKIACRLKLSGIHGLDFMRGSGTGNAYLIEVNPRATQVGHLALGPGRDLAAALFAAVAGEVPQPAPMVTVKDTIALFPQEWIRDPASSYLREAYHDVPWEAPYLLRACIRSRRPQFAWYSTGDEVKALRQLISSSHASTERRPDGSGRDGDGIPMPVMKVPG